jgi:intracellular septation protein
MKLILDFLPIVLFFIVFKYAENHKEWASSWANEHLGFMVSGGVISQDMAPILLATLVVMVATGLQIALLLARGKKVDLMLWISLGLITVMGGATVWFHNDQFIKWKPSVLYWMMGLNFIVSQWLFKKNLLKTMMGEQLSLPDAIWQKLSWAWVAFFTVMGVLNLYVAFSFSQSTWVDFKMFGTTGLMLIFTVGQGIYLSRHLHPKEPK